MSKKITLAIVDDDANFLNSIKKIIEVFPNCKIIGEYTSAHKAVLDLPNLHPNLLLLDYELKEGYFGPELFNVVRDNQMKVIYVTNHDEKLVELANEENVRGVICKRGGYFENNLKAIINTYFQTQSEIRNNELRFNKENFSSNNNTIQIILRNRETVEVSRNEIMYFEQEQDYPFIIIFTISGLYEAVFKSFIEAEQAIKSKEVDLYRVKSKGGCCTINLKYYHGEKLPNYKIRLKHFSKECIIQCAERPYNNL